MSASYNASGGTAGQPIAVKLNKLCRNKRAWRGTVTLPIKIGLDLTAQQIYEMSKAFTDNGLGLAGRTVPKQRKSHIQIVA